MGWFGLDDKQDKRIADNVEWITHAAVIFLRKLGSLFKIDLPPAPPYPPENNA